MALMESRIIDGVTVCRDDWLANLIGRDALSVIFDLTKINTPKFYEDLRQWRLGLARGAFVYTKVPTDCVTLSVQLQSLDFHVIDTQVGLEKILKPKISALTQDVRLATTEDEEDVVRLAGLSFRYSRFHLDPRLNPLAAKIKMEWARNFFRGKRGDFMAVIRHQKETVGFAQVLRRANSTLVLDLIAVDAKVRAKGLGGRLLAFVETGMADANKITVGTQAANVEAVRFYESAGYRMTSSSHVLHCHNY